MGNSYLENAYDDEQMAAVAEREGYDSFQEMVAKMSLDGLSLSDIARKLDLVPQRFTAYHARWMQENAEPLDLEDV